MPNNVLDTYNIIDITTSSQKMRRYINRLLPLLASRTDLDVTMGASLLTTMYNDVVSTTGTPADRLKVAIKLSKLRKLILTEIQARIRSTIGGDYYIPQLPSALGNFIAGVPINSSYALHHSLDVPRGFDVELWIDGLSFSRLVDEYFGEDFAEIGIIGIQQKANGTFVYSPDASTPPYVIGHTVRSSINRAEINRGHLRDYTTPVQDCIDGVREYLIEKVYGRDIFAIGLELECEATRRNITNTIFEQFSDYCILKRDSSLSERSGFEIVTRPEEPKYHRKRMAALLDATKGGMVSYNTTTCGFHVHVNLGFFNLEKGSDGQFIDTNPVAIGKLFTFMYNPDNYGFLKRIAQRDWLNNSYCVRPKQLKKLSDAVIDSTNFEYNFESRDIKFDKEFILDTNNLNNHRKVALNITDKDTLEFRLFKGTCSKLSLLAKIDFVEAICYWVKSKSASVNGLTVPKFFEWLNKESEYNYLKTFIKKYNLAEHELITNYKNVEREQEDLEAEEVRIDNSVTATTSQNTPSASDIHTIRIGEYIYRRVYRAGRDIDVIEHNNERYITIPDSILQELDRHHYRDITRATSFRMVDSHRRSIIKIGQVPIILLNNWRIPSEYYNNPLPYTGNVGTSRTAVLDGVREFWTGTITTC